MAPEPGLGTPLGPWGSMRALSGTSTGASGAQVGISPQPGHPCPGQGFLSVLCTSVGTVGH